MCVLHVQPMLCTCLSLHAVYMYVMCLAHYIRISKSLHHAVVFEDQKSKSDSGKVLLTSMNESQGQNPMILLCSHIESNDNAVDDQHIEIEKGEGSYHIIVGY